VALESNTLVSSDTDADIERTGPKTLVGNSGWLGRRRRHGRIVFSLERLSELYSPELSYLNRTFQLRSGGVERSLIRHYCNSVNFSIVLSVRNTRTHIICS